MLLASTRRCVASPAPMRAIDGQPGVHALAATDLTLRRGEFYAVIGPSGCGKSTLLDVLAGLSRPTAGTITFEGKRVDGKVPDGIGVVFQEDASFSWLTVADNIVFGLRRAGTDPAEVDAATRLCVAADGACGLRKVLSVATLGWHAPARLHRPHSW